MIPGYSPSRSLFTAVAAMAVCIGYGRFGLGLLLPEMKTDLGLTYAQAGMLVSLNLAAYLVGVWLSPRLSYRMSHIRIVQTGLVLAALGMAMLAYPGPTILVPVALTLTGFAGAFGWISGAAIGASLASPGRRGLMMGVIGAANGLGIITSSAFALLLVASDGSVSWRYVWLVQASIAIITLFPALRAPGFTSNPPARTKPTRLWGLKAAYGCFGVGYAWFATYYVASIDQTNGLPSAAMWSVVGIGSLFGSVLFGIWSDAWGRRQVLVVSQIVAASACAVMIVASETLAGGVVGGLLFGAVLTGMASLVPAALADMVGNEAVASSFASLTLVFAAIQTVAPVVGGFVVDHAPGDFNTLYGMCLVVFMAGAALFSRYVTNSHRTDH